MKKLITFNLLLFINFFLFAQDRYYPLDGNALEMLHGYSGNLGTGSHAPIPTTDRFNNPNSALYFDGNDTLGLPKTGMGTNEFSISAWIYYPVNSTILRYWFCYGTWGSTDQSGGIGPSVYGDGLFFSGYRKAAMNYYELFTKGQPPVNQWYHVCGVYSLNYTKFYVNGMLVDSSASAGIVPDYGLNPRAFIGSRSDTIGGWIGKIDNLYYFDHALSTAQVAALVASESDIVTGNCFLDLNKNSIKDAGESNANGVYVISNSASRSFTNQTNNAGFFRTLVDTGSISTYVRPMSYYNILPLNFSSNHSTFGAVDTVNFALQPTGTLTDVGVVLIPVSSAVPGFISRYDLVYTNYGTDTASGTIRLIIDKGMLYGGSTPTVNSVSGDTLFWSFSNLYPLQSSTINLKLQVAPPPVVDLGDTLQLCLSVATSNTDFNFENNLSCIEQIVIGSHDPNDKTVVEGNKITLSRVSTGKYLTYVIRFQNTGTANAVNISVKDTLSSLLEWNSLQMINSSHAYILNIMDGNVLEWRFNNIQLPDSNHNEPLSHGYICYQVKPLTTLNPGDLINNTAYIYFDFNLPVITNTVQATVIENIITATIDKEFNMLSVYPNPVTNQLVIDGINANGTLKIFNSLGEKLMELKATNKKTIISTSSFAAGVYYIAYDNYNVQLKKMFIKQ